MSTTTDHPGSVFVTGAAAGIGAATVRRLAGLGFTVFAGVHRDPGDFAAAGAGGGGGAGGGDVRLVTLDVTDPGSVAAAVGQIAAEVGPGGLQAVVNNAGVIVQGPQELLEDGELRRQFEINTFGPVSVTRHCLPLLRAGHGRVVNISAPTALVAIPFLGPIGASKAALESLSGALRLELAPWRIPVVLVVPGGTATAIFDKAEATFKDALTRTDPQTAALYVKQLDAVAAAAGKQQLVPAETVARLIATAVTARRPKRRYTARNARAFAVLPHLPAALRERAVLAVLNLKP